MKRFPPCLYISVTLSDLLIIVTRVCLAHAFAFLSLPHLILELLPITLPQVRSKWLPLCDRLAGIRRKGQ